jgi:cyclic pyranopterin phosphate synthase
MASRLTHLDDSGAARMVDVSAKAENARMARAEGAVRMRPETLAAIFSGKTAKGDVLAVARVAGIMAAKKTSELIPLCHPLPLSQVTIDFRRDDKGSTLVVTATVTVTSRTGVEMEALTAVSVACLTIYDMAKAIDRAMEITGIRLLEKEGGRSGSWRRGE